MNGRKAKRLFKEAMSKCATMEESDMSLTVYQDYAAPRFAPINGKGALANQVVDYVKVANGIPRKLTDSCVRAVYQKLK